MDLLPVNRSNFFYGMLSLTLLQNKLPQYFSFPESAFSHFLDSLNLPASLKKPIYRVLVEEPLSFAIHQVKPRLDFFMAYGTMIHIFC